MFFNLCVPVGFYTNKTVHSFIHSFINAMILALLTFNLSFKFRFTVAFFLCLASGCDEERRSVAKYMRESIVFCSTCTTSSLISSRSLSHLLMSLNCFPTSGLWPTAASASACWHCVLSSRHPCYYCGCCILCRPYLCFFLCFFVCLFVCLFLSFFLSSSSSYSSCPSTFSFTSHRGNN